MIAALSPRAPCLQNTSSHCTCVQARHVKPLGQGGRPTWGFERTPWPEVNGTASGLEIA